MVKFLILAGLAILYYHFEITFTVNTKRFMKAQETLIPKIETVNEQVSTESKDEA